MSFRAAGFRHAGFRAALALGLAWHWGAAQAQGMPPAKPSPSAPAVASRPGDAGTGRAKAAVCGACHGVDGHSSDPQYPDLAGQHESYIVRQLNNFRTGKRQNPIMMAMVVALSEQDMHDIGAYFAGKPPVPGTADPTPASTTRGRTLFREGDAARGIPACMACHMIDGRGNPGAGYPQLAGQHARYVEATLKAWHDGASWGDDARAQIMPSIARRLDPSDIAAVAGYIEGLRATGEEAAPAAAP